MFFLFVNRSQTGKGPVIAFNDDRYDIIQFTSCRVRRLNKIGISPSMMAHHEEEEEDDDGSDSKTINAVVNALSEQAEQANTSIESEGSRSVLTEIGRSLHMLTASLPRPKSECNFATIVEHQPVRMMPWTLLHRSDIIQNQVSVGGGGGGGDEQPLRRPTENNGCESRTKNTGPSWSSAVTSSRDTNAE